MSLWKNITIITMERVQRIVDKYIKSNTNPICWQLKSQMLLKSGIPEIILIIDIDPFHRIQNLIPENHIIIEMIGLNKAHGKWDIIWMEDKYRKIQN